MFSAKKILKKVFAFVFAFSMLSAYSFAEEDEEWFWNKPIASISFEGLRSVKRSELAGVTNSFIGKEFTNQVYSDILDRLYNLAYFTNIDSFAKHYSKDKDSKDYNKIHLVLQVKEHPTILSIDFKGNRKIRNNELRDTVAVKVGDVYIDSAVLLDERSLRDLYIKKGYQNATVTNNVVETEDGMKVVFYINEGSESVVRTISFEGNTVFSDRTLRSKISLKSEGFMRNGAFQKSALEVDKQKIVAYYMTKGYVDAFIKDVVQVSSFNEKKGREEIDLTFVISEGAQYTYQGLTIRGNSIFSTEKLLSFIKLKKGDVFNQLKFQEGIANLTNLYYENGYMSNQFIPSENKDAEQHTVSYTLTIAEYSRAHVENIIIKGNTKTKDYVILRELPVKPGDVFSRDKSMAGLRNLYNLQYFSSIVPEPKQGSEPNLVDLVVTVEEQSTTSIQFGMTFSGIEDPDDLPISLFAKWQNSNLNGLGKTIGIGANISSSGQEINFNYSQNWIGDQPIQLSETLSLSHGDSSALAMNWLSDGVLNDDYYYFNYQSWGASLNTSLGRRWTPNFAIVTLSGGLTNSLIDNIYDESLYSPLDSGVNKYANRFGLKNSVYGSFSVDNRDINYDPSTGWFASERIAWYGLIPGVEHEFYFRTDTKLEAYLKLVDIPLFNNFWNFKIVLAAYTGLSAIVPMPGSLFGDSSKVYIDGMFNGRGWTSISNDARGKAMLSNKLEVRIPLFQGVLGLDGFFDAVAVKDEPEQIFNGLSIEDFYFSFGPGLRFLVPQFPLHLLFANKFRIIDGNVEWDKTWQFVLSFNVTNR